MPDFAWLLQLGGIVLASAVFFWFVLRRTLRSVYSSDTGRPEDPPNANSANDRTPPGA